MEFRPERKRKKAYEVLVQDQEETEIKPQSSVSTGP